MENPYPWPQVMRQQWVDFIHNAPINRYPDPEASALKELLHQQLHLPADIALLLGNGSDELIQVLAMALAGPGRVILSFDPGFVMYRLIATWTGAKYIGIPLHQQDFSIDVESILTAMATFQPALLFIAYPNNPTGNLFAADAIEHIIQAATGIVVIDEAYAPFTDASFINALGKYPNLLVLRTLSKMGLAGLRLGYLLGDVAWINELAKVRLPYNINMLTQMTANFALQHRDVLDAQTALIRTERQYLWQQLNALPGVQAYPSDANFILFRIPQAQKVFTKLKSQGILLKCLHGSSQMLENCLRVTVGTPAENAALMSALQHILYAT